jgi:hypothetical protein
MKKCKFCMTEIDDKAKVCPQCGRKQPSKAKKIVGIVLLALCAIIVIAAIAGGSGDKDKPASAAGTVETQAPENTDPVAKLSYNKLETVTEAAEGRTNYGSQCINGAIKNTSVSSCPMWVSPSRCTIRTATRSVLPSTISVT